MGTARVFAAAFLLVSAVSAWADEAHIQADAPAEAAELGKKALATAKAIGLDKNEVQGRLGDFAERQRIVKQIADPKDAQSRAELVRLLVVEMDDPAQAPVLR